MRGQRVGPVRAGVRLVRRVVCVSPLVWVDAAGLLGLRFSVCALVCACSRAWVTRCAPSCGARALVLDLWGLGVCRCVGLCVGLSVRMGCLPRVERLN